MQQRQPQDYFQTLYEVVKAVNSSLDPKEVLSQVAEKTSWAMGVKACSIRLLSEDKKYLQAGATYGLSQSYLRKGRIEVAKSRIDQEVLAGETVTICNACSDEKFQYPEAAEREGIKSVLAVPLSLRGQEIIGVLRVYSAEERDFSSSEVDFLKTMADLCALAIQNAKRHESLRSDFELLTAFEYRLFED